MSSKIISAPSGEPVALADAKKHLRVDFADDDNLILTLISAARQQAETICRRALVSQQWKVVLDQFPVPGMNIGSANWYGPQWGISPGPLTVLSPSGKTGYEIYLPLPPLVSVDSIQYIDVNGIKQTLDPSLYIVDDISEPARITPSYGATWPGTQNVINAVIVTFTTGYGTPSDVPQAIKQWMLLAIGAMYENREADVLVARGSVASMPFADGLLEPYRCVSF
jgi:hypothetical protein